MTSNARKAAPIREAAALVMLTSIDRGHHLNGCPRPSLSDNAQDGRPQGAWPARGEVYPAVARSAASAPDPPARARSLTAATNQSGARCASAHTLTSAAKASIDLHSSTC